MLQLLSCCWGLLLLGGFKCLLFRAAATVNCLFLSSRARFQQHILRRHNPKSDSFDFSRPAWYINVSFVIAAEWYDHLTHDDDQIPGCSFLMSHCSKYTTPNTFWSTVVSFPLSFMHSAVAEVNSRYCCLNWSLLIYDQGLCDELAVFLELQANSIKDKSSVKTGFLLSTQSHMSQQNTL